MTADPDETAVAAANLAFYRALEARDLSAMELVWIHDETASCIHPGWHRLDGWGEIRRSWENIFANARPWSVAYEDLRIRVAGDVAWVTCVELLSPFGTDPEEGSARMQATNIFARRDGSWGMLHHHASPTSAAGAEEEDQPVN